MKGVSPMSKKERDTIHDVIVALRFMLVKGEIEGDSRRDLVLQIDTLHELRR